jgi:hypothetical protein
MPAPASGCFLPVGLLVLSHFLICLLQPKREPVKAGMKGYALKQGIGKLEYYQSVRYKR